MTFSFLHKGVECLLSSYQQRTRHNQHSTEWYSFCVHRVYTLHHLHNKTPGPQHCAGMATGCNEGKGQFSVVYGSQNLEEASISPQQYFFSNFSKLQSASLHTLSLLAHVLELPLYSSCQLTCMRRLSTQKTKPTLTNKMQININIVTILTILFVKF